MSLGICAVAAAWPHTMLLTDHGEILVYAEDGRRVPMPAAPLGRVVALAAGGSHHLALDHNGRVCQWGTKKASRLLGRADADIVFEAARPVPRLPAIAAIAAGPDYSLACTRTGSVYSWGTGQWLLADGTGDSRGDPLASCAPRPIAGIRNVVAVAAGERHALALTAAGVVIAWGAEFEALAGGIDSRPVKRQPHRIDGLGDAGIVQIACGADYSLAVNAQGTVFGWGSNVYGCLGPGFGTVWERPGAISGLPPIARISAWHHRVLALACDGDVYGWGVDVRGSHSTDLMRSGMPLPIRGIDPGVLMLPFAAGSGAALGYRDLERHVRSWMREALTL